MNFWRLFPLLLVSSAVGLSQGVIRLKTRDLLPNAGWSQARGPVEASKLRHYLVLFQAYPGPDVLAELSRRRIRVLSYVPDNALMVSATILNLQGLGVVWSGPMDPADKISPVAAMQMAGAYLVIFQPDTEMGPNGALLAGLGFTVAPNASLLPGQVMVTGAYSGLAKLAALDAVAYILPASAELQGGEATLACAGALTAAGRVAEYVQAASGWSKDAGGGVNLQYFFDSLTPKVTESLVRSEVARAFAQWAQYANINIAAANAPGLTRSIDILFARFAHGDAYSFDGPGGQLAHTYYPAPSNSESIAGDMHLDADESWTVGGSGVDLYSVVLHETGHALGLGHSDNPGVVMYPYYRVQTSLTADDIAGVQAIYGAKPQPAQPVTPPSSGGNSGSTSNPGTGNSPTGGASPPVEDTTPPVLSILSPSSTIVTAYAASITMSGSAGDNVGVASVKWSTSTGNSGMATGTTSWSASVPLLQGNNIVTVRAYDAAGNSTWRAITVVRN